MPPPGVAGSKKATIKADASLGGCELEKGRAKEPATLLAQLARSCSETGWKPAGPLIRGEQADHDAHQEYRVHVDPNKCYRVVFAAEESIQDAVVAMRDSAGDAVSESAGATLPEDGALCFRTADDVVLTIAIGSGRGKYAAQVWAH